MFLTKMDKKNRNKSSVQEDKLNISSLPDIALYVIADLSLKYHENAFIYFT